MKTIYSLQEFYDQVLELAKNKGEDYASVSVEMNSHEGLKFGCYIHSRSWEFGKTMEECIQNQRDKMFPPAPPNIDVEIEMSPTDEIVTIIDPLSLTNYK